METTSNKVFAVAGSLVVHVLVLLVLYLGLLHQPELVADAGQGPAIEATLISTPQQSAAAIRRIETSQRQVPPTPPQPKPAPVPQDSPQPQQLVPQTQLPKPDTVDQDEVRRLGEQAAQRQLQEQDERRRQAQVDLARQQEQTEAENHQRQAQQDLEKQLAAIRKQRADAEHQVKLQEEKLKQIADLAARNNQQAVAATAPAPARPTNTGVDDRAGLEGKYVAAIKAVVHENWRPQDVPRGQHCLTHYKQLPGGEVFDVTFGECSFDAAAKASVEDALKRTPLPYAGFESVFQREGNIDMCDPEDACE
ncbi:MAG TPA: protein TolA [Xanthomonadaceae bacterium]|jgi:colicin import membrane protein|nr:protein TolA [Xanthomonadaceae bacterium]